MTSIQISDKFYYVMEDKSVGEPVLYTCTVTKVTPHRVYFTTSPRPVYGNDIGKLDSRHNRYLEPDRHWLKYRYAADAAARFSAITTSEAESLERKLDKVNALFEKACQLHAKLMEEDDAH